MGKGHANHYRMVGEWGEMENWDLSTGWGERERVGVGVGLGLGLGLDVRSESDRECESESESELPHAFALHGWLSPPSATSAQALPALQLHLNCPVDCRFLVALASYGVGGTV